jgi:hypothetical protein
MVAYSYQKRFEPKIRALIKPQTMRNERKRHARPGEEIQHYYAMRTKQCRLIGRSICIAVTPVRIDFSRNVIKVEGRPYIQGVVGLNAFSVRDGFEDWDDMVDFWNDTHVKDDGVVQNHLTAWSGMLIEWKDFKGEPL